MEVLKKYRWLWLIFLALSIAGLFSIGQRPELFLIASPIFYGLLMLIAYRKALLLGLFALSQLPMTALQGSTQDFGWLQGLIFSFIFLACLGLSYFLARKYGLIEAPKLKAFPWLKILIGLALLFAVGGLLGWVFKAPSTGNQTALDNLQAHVPWLFFSVTVVAAGFFEELVFRVGFIGYVFEKIPWLGFLSAFLLFALIHGPSDLYSWLLYGSASLILTVFYYRYRNFYLNMSIHLLWNLLGLLLPLIIK